MNNYFYDEQECHEFIVVQEVTVLRTYTVEAASLVNAIEQIECQDYSGVIEENDTIAEKEPGRIVSVSINDKEA